VPPPEIFGFARTSAFSGGVVSIYLHVLLRKVAAPSLRFAVAQPEFGGDLDLRCSEGLSHRFQVDQLARSGREHGQAADPHGEPVDGELRATVPERANDAAP